MIPIVPPRAQGRVLDLLDDNSLRSLGLVENQLTGPIGAHTLEGLKASALNMKYTYIAYRDPIRPGIAWVEDLLSGKRSYWKELEAAKLLERLCPGLIADWQCRGDDPLNWEMVYPPVNTPPLQYARALEWLVRKYPDAVVAWVELSIIYENDLKIPYAISPMFEECRVKSSHWRVIGHVIGCEIRP